MSKSGERDYYELSNWKSISSKIPKLWAKVVNVTITSYLTNWKSIGSKIPKIWAKVVNVTITSYLTNWKSISSKIPKLWAKVVNVTITSYLTNWKSIGSKIPKIWAKIMNVTITSYLTNWKSTGFTPWVTKSECEVVFTIYRDRLLPWLPNPMRLVSLCNLQFPVKSTLEKNKTCPNIYSMNKSKLTILRLTE